MRDRFPVVLGTLVSQTLLNILALCVLGSVMFATVGRVQPRRGRARDRHHRSGRAARARDRGAVDPAPRQAVALPARAAGGCGRAPRDGPGAHRPPGVQAAAARRLGRHDAAHARGRSSGSPATCCSWRSGSTTTPGIGAAAAVLFAVNVTAALPATPSNLGVFQAACVAVLSAYGVEQDQRLRLRDHPSGGRDRDGARDGHARARARGHDLEGPPPARPARGAGGAAQRAPRRRRERASALPKHAARRVRTDAA